MVIQHQLLKKIGSIKMKINNYLTPLLLLSLVLLFSCTQQNHDEISSIKIKYIRGHYAFDESIECQDIYTDSSLSSIISDTVLISKSLLSKINSELNSLNQTVEKNNYIGPRIRCEVNFTNNEQLVLCIGEYFGMTLNGVKYEDNLNLSYLIKRHSGYYQYFTYEFLIHFKELEESYRLDTILNEMKEIRYINTDHNYDTITEINRL
jgi:hypothetical protein